jgi:subtilisin family serine protease
VSKEYDMEREFTILRDPVLAFPSDPYGGGSAARGGVRSSERAAALEIEVATLDKDGLRDVVASRGVRAVAPVIPTKLIFPVPMDGAGPDPAASGGGPTWGVAAVGADQSAMTGAGVTVAVLDTGIDAAHPAFQGVNLVEEDFSGAGSGDVQGHGTHCAGTVFGRDVGGNRIGVAPGVTTALIGKVLGDDGSGNSDMIFRGIQWAVQQGAQVVSMSIGFDFPGYVASLVQQGWPADLATSVALEGYRANLRMFDAIMEVVEATQPFGSGAILVAAAGNESRRDVNADYEIGVSIPAAAQGIVSVGALEQGDTGLGIAYFSNTFPMISGPGVQVLSAQANTGGLVAMSGTSMATPHVAGVTALFWEEVGGLGIPVTATNVLARMLARADVGAIASGVDVADRGVGLVRAP